MDIIDRRLNPKAKSLGNRQCFLHRAKAKFGQTLETQLPGRRL